MNEICSSAVEGVEGGSFIIDDPARATAMAIFRCILGGGSKPTATSRRRLGFKKAILKGAGPLPDVVVV
jgi:hypothetical protein